MKYLLFNPASGAFRRDPALAARLVATARRREPALRVVPCRPDELTTHAARAAESEASVVIACGGDGTLSAVGRALAGTPTALGVVPLGTLNHFARDLGVPADMDAALAVALDGVARRVDVGRVNDTTFLNNASIGVYPFIVEEREKTEDEVGKWTALTQALGKAWQTFPTERVRLSVDGAAETLIETPLLFVGNNRYGLTLTDAGRRARLDAGELSICVARAANQLELLGAAVATYFAGPDGADGVHYVTARRVRVRPEAPRIKIGLDGEATELEGPLEFRCEPGALCVRVSAAGPPDAVAPDAP